MLQTTLLAALSLTWASAPTEPPCAGLSSPAETAVTSVDGEDSFPHRKKYSECTPITTEDLAALENPIIIDARNKAEFSVIQIHGALNIILEKMKMEQLLKLRGKDDERPLVFYCNGHT